MNKIKQYWKEILIGLLIVFGLNKCTVACNRSTKIDVQQTELVQKDSIIKIQSDSLNILRIRWNDAQNSQSTYQGIALGNQQELINQINTLKQEKESLSSKINNLNNENSKLKKTISEMKSKLK